MPLPSLPDPRLGALATLHLRFTPMGIPRSTAHAAADDNIMTALGPGAHNISGLPHSFPLASAIVIPSHGAVSPMSLLVSSILGLLSLFIFYPVMTFYRDEKRNNATQVNVRVNATGVFFVVSSIL
jgi:hypothetical protein